MEEYRRLLVNTRDRIGMTLDVLQVVYRYWNGDSIYD
jgi:hypothetical protein